MTIPIVVLLLAGLPGNVHQLRIYANQRSSIARAQITHRRSSPRRGLPLAKEFGAAVAARAVRGLTMGWLVASLPSGRIPPPDRLTPKRSRPRRSQLAVQPVARRQPQAVRAARRAGDAPAEAVPALTLKHGLGLHHATSRPPASSRSRSPFPGARRSIVGGSTVPLHIEIEPAQQDHDALHLRVYRGES